MIGLELRPIASIFAEVRIILLGQCQIMSIAGHRMEEIDGEAVLSEAQEISDEDASNEAPQPSRCPWATGTDRLRVYPDIHAHKSGQKMDLPHSIVGPRSADEVDKCA